MKKTICILLALLMALSAVCLYGENRGACGGSR
jgi:hypothetical protein